VEALPKGNPQADGAREVSESSPFQSACDLLGQDQRAEYRRVESWPLFERMGEEHTYPLPFSIG
jgi:hypothetical protein